MQKWKHDIDSKVHLPNGEHVPVVLLANKCEGKTGESGLMDAWALGIVLYEMLTLMVRHSRSIRCYTLLHPLHLFTPRWNALPTALIRYSSVTHQ